MVDIGCVLVLDGSDVFGGIPAWCIIRDGSPEELSNFRPQALVITSITDSLCKPATIESRARKVALPVCFDRCARIGQHVEFIQWPKRPIPTDLTEVITFS